MKQIILILAICVSQIITCKLFGQDFETVNAKIVSIVNEGKLTEALPLNINLLQTTKEREGDTSAHYVTCLGNLAYIYDHLNDSSKAEEFYIKTINIWKNANAIRTSFFVIAQDNLAFFYQNHGQLEKAEKLLVSSLEIRKLVFTENSKEYATGLDNLCNVFIMRDEYPEQIEKMLVQAVDIREHILPKNHPDIPLAYFNLGFHYEKTKRFENAVEPYAAALAIYEQDIPKNRVNYKYMLNILAAVYTQLQQFSKTEDLYNKVIELTKSSPQSADYASAVNNLGYIYYLQNKYKKAEPLLLKSLQIRKQIGAENIGDYATNLNNLGSLYKDQGKNNEALPLLTEAVNLRRSVYGPKSKNYAVGLDNLASLHGNMGHRPEAEKLFLEELEISKNDPDNWFGYITCLTNLGSLYSDMARFAEAENLDTISLNIRKKIYGESNDEYIVALNNLAQLYQTQERFDDAMNVYLKALALYADKGKITALYAVILNNAAIVYQKTYNYSKADSLFSLALSTQKSINGENSVQYATCLDNYASYHSENYHFEIAEKQYMQALSIREKITGVDNPDYALTLNNLADLYSKKADYIKSIEYNIKALEIRKQLFGLADKDCGQSINNLASAYQNSGDYSKADSLFKMAAEIYKISPGENSPDYFMVQNNLGSLYADMGLLKKSVDILTKNTESKKKFYGQSDPEYAMSINNLATLYIRFSNFPFADSLLQAARKILINKHLELSYDYALVLNNIAEVHSETGHYPESEKEFNEVSAIQLKLLGYYSPGYALAIANLAGVYRSTGSLFKAEANYKKCLEIYKNLYETDHPKNAVILNNLGQLYREMGKLDEAEILLADACRMYKKIFGENADFALAQSNLAIVFQDKQQFTQAEILAKNSVAIYKTVSGENVNYALAVSNLSQLYFQMNNYELAVRNAEQSKAIIKKLLGIDHASYAIALNNLAELYASANKYKLAEQLMDSAILIREKILGKQHPDYSNSLFSLATLYSDEGKYDTAIVLFKKTLSVKDGLGEKETAKYAMALDHLGYLYEAKRDYKNSEFYYKAALANYLKNMGAEYPDYGNCFNNLGAMYEKQGKYAEAAQSFQAGTKIIFDQLNRNMGFLSEEEKMKWWTKENFNFDFLPSLLLSVNAPNNDMLKAVFNQQLTIRGYLLNNQEQILYRLRQTTDSFVKRSFTEWMTNNEILYKQATVPIVSRIPELDSLKQVTNQLQKQLNKLAQDSVVSQSSQEIDFRRISSKLKQNEVGLEFIRFNYFHNGWTDSVLYGVFILKASDSVPRFVYLCTEKQLQSILNSKNNTSADFLNTLYPATGSIQKNDSSSLILYNLIWKPILPHITGINSIYFAPVGLLNRISFKALTADGSHYLVDNYQLRQYTSLKEIDDKFKPNKSISNVTDIVMFGGINYSDVNSTISSETKTKPSQNIAAYHSNRQSWPYLPYTLSEVNNIEKLYKVDNKSTELWKDTAATEEHFKLLNNHSPGIIHLASHGFWKPSEKLELDSKRAKLTNAFAQSENPMFRNGIVLARGNAAWTGTSNLNNREDGILTAYEISSLNLSNTNLVVLSACESALGDIQGNEGVYGLQRAFKLAGVDHLIVSLWRVSDVKTSELMTQFYVNKLKGVSDFEALNAAQKTIRQTNIPFYWAGFVLIE